MDLIIVYRFLKRALAVVRNEYRTTAYRILFNRTIRIEKIEFGFKALIDIIDNGANRVVLHYTKQPGCKFIPEDTAVRLRFLEHNLTI